VSRKTRDGGPGPIVAIGGAEDKLRERLILRRFVELAGGPAARLVVLPTASQLASTGPLYQQLFRKLGADRVDVLAVNTREDAVEPDWSEAVAAATGVFMTGGNQVRLSSVLGGTPLAEAIRRAHAGGAVVGGTSAGASILCEHMIAFGRRGAIPHQRMVHLAPGLGLTNRVIIDQHFRQRDRVGRLLTAVAYNPFLVGLGLDEDTAVIIDARQQLEVIGRHGVLVVDASALRHTNVHEAGGHSPLALLGVRLDVLVQGYRYDLERRTAFAPDPQPA
jgi:cyanophycinase